MNIQYKIRSGFIFLFFCSLYLIILCNLYSIQIKQRNFFMHLGQQQYNVTVKNKPPRALIYDRNDHPLALNKQRLSAFIMPKKIKTIEQLEPFLKTNYPEALKRLYASPNAHFLYVKRKLTPEQIKTIEEKQISDIKFLQEPNRMYPVQSLGPIVGITDIDNEGLFGIELLYNDRLAGTPTTYMLEKDARSGQYYFEKRTTEQGAEGKPVTLTIDANLQFLVHEELRETVEIFHAQEGAVIVMNPSNGEIIALAQEPTFNPNNTESLNLEYTKNKPLTDVHELGSVMKVFVALAALEEGVVEPDELIDCENTKSTLLNGMPVNTWRAHGIIPFSEVIQVSNNIGIAKVAQRLGPLLYEHYKRLGFGNKTSLNWPGQQKGFVNPPHNWSKKSLISLSFGYEITASLLQLAQAFCIIANNGYPIRPTLVRDPHPESVLMDAPLYHHETITIIRDILEKTVKQGTARRAALQGYRIMGKTGTANLLIDGTYNPDHNTHTFIGIIAKAEYKQAYKEYVKTK